MKGKPKSRVGRPTRHAPAASWRERLPAALLFAAVVLAVVATVKLGDRSGTPPALPPATNAPAPPSEQTSKAPPPTLNPDEKSSQLANEGNRRLEAGDAKGAEAAYRQALELNPEDEDLYYNLGIALARQNRLSEAEAAYREALRLFPEYPEVHNNLGNVLTRQKRLDEAVTHFLAALEHLPGYASAHNNYGIALQQLGRFPEALEQFEKAVQADTNYWEARLNLGNSAAAQGLDDRAIAAFRDVLRQRPDFEPARRALEAVLARQQEKGRSANP
jgi:tetratricopeptide (TPR) repeat protein